MLTNSINLELILENNMELMNSTLEFKTMNKTWISSNNKMLYMMQVTQPSS